jgi:hypothetical protein
MQKNTKCFIGAISGVILLGYGAVSFLSNVWRYSSSVCVGGTGNDLMMGVYLVTTFIGVIIGATCVYLME